MREKFDLRRRLNRPDHKDTTFTIDPPDELPRTVQLPFYQKAAPWVLGIAVIGIFVMIFLTGAQMIRNPMYMIFMLMLVFSAVGSINNVGGQSDKSTSEVNSDRSEYLRYLSGKANEIREAKDTQMARAKWSHPDPAILEAYLGTRRMWERTSPDDDFLQVRIGLDTVALTNPIKVKRIESELDLEPVAKVALQNLRSVQQSIPHCPKAIDLKGTNLITISGDRTMFRGAVRSWAAQLVTWHAPDHAALAVASPNLEIDWGWTKWLPHVENTDFDGAGRARYLSESLAEVTESLKPLLTERAEVIKTVNGRDTVDQTVQSPSGKHVLVIVDDPSANLAEVRALAVRAGVTVVLYQEAMPHRDKETHGRELMLRIEGGQDELPHMLEWRNFGWKPFCDEPDTIAPPVARHLARMLARWDNTPSIADDGDAIAAQTILSSMNIRNGARLNFDELWSATKPIAEQLTAVLGLQPNGAPLPIDFKSEDAGGMGPHGLMIGMTGSGKTSTLRSLLMQLLTKNSPDVLRAILADFKGEAGFDEFADYPGVVGVVSNMLEKQSMVERFGDTLLGLMDQRERILKAAGTEYKGSAFEKVEEYEQARMTPAGAHLPPMPTMLVWVDEFSLLLQDHPDMADVFDKVTRKGRSLHVFFLFASQTLDEGTIKKIPQNTQFRVGLKVASSSISRQVIGTEDCYHIAQTDNAIGTGFLVRAPGAEPVKFRGFKLPNSYEPPQQIHRHVVAAKPRPRLFTAGRVSPDDQQVVETIVDQDDNGAESIVPKLLPNGVPPSLVMTIGLQQRAYWDKNGHAIEQVWSPPLDDPIALNTVLEAVSEVKRAGLWWPLGEVDVPRMLTHYPLVYDTSAGNVALVGGAKSGRSTAVQTFVLAGSDRYSPEELGFYIFAHGGPEPSAVRHLPHVAACASKDNRELWRRMFGDLDELVDSRRRLFGKHDVGSFSEFRRRRAAGDVALKDNFPTDVFVIVDNWEDFLKDNTSLMFPRNPMAKNIEAYAAASSYGVHLLVTAGSWITFSQQLNDTLTCRWELKMSDGSGSKVRAKGRSLKRPQDAIPADQPGRGINVDGDQIRFAVGRLDGKPSIEGLDEKIRESVTAISDKYAGHTPAAAPRLLPLTLPPADLHQELLRGEQIALGQRGSDLRPWVIDFEQSPLLGVFGDGGSGRSTPLRHIIRTVAATRESPEEKMLCIFDTKRDLVDELDGLIEGQDLYETDIPAIAARIAQIATKLGERGTSQDMGWAKKRDYQFDGPVVYLIIDNYDSLPDVAIDSGGIQRPLWAPLLPVLLKPRDVGLRVILSHRANGASQTEVIPNRPPGQIHQQNGPRILLNSKNSKEKLGGIGFEAGLPPGRGIVVSAKDEDNGYVQIPEVLPLNQSSRTR
ncbi:cell division protein FtsK [Mycobacteroides abscessus subsp. abscessus]|uniref:type VII secretion protein EccCa n=1 Tax=Mycobacteroides abscessus TaxID=36809 RepID=UPI00092CCBBD|nr:type VII secretion protein EccCa [Mycobacteroides abscessus]SIJ21937.1 cell division protein FtsK [Mycobacteroides abscessus subsp. abscessus]SLH38690.1 cell division protein FtsK [Mycobacteroides abscessus subsp. abscessus]